MNKQRLISFVAVLCLAQLAIITSRQLQDKDSDLQVLRARVQSAFSLVSDLFSGNHNSSLNTVSDTIAKPAQLAPVRSGELAPTFLKDDAPAVQVANRATAPSLLIPPDSAPKKDAGRDPFVPFFSIRSGAQGDSAHPLTGYDLSELRVAAIIGDAAGNRSASVQASDGKNFIVKVGAKIGENGGRVESITATSIVISEPSHSSVGDEGAVIKELSLKTYPTPASALAQ
jgi:hypothetical protein